MGRRRWRRNGCEQSCQTNRTCAYARLIAAPRSGGDERNRDGRLQPEPETLEREVAIPKAWEAALDRHEDFIEELLGG